MITFSKLGKKGNLGNQLFQVASTMSLAIKHGHTCVLPNWEYESYFTFDFPHGEISEAQPILEKFYHFHTWDIKNGNYDLYGYLQSEKYFDPDLLSRIFKFDNSFLKYIRLKKPDIDIEKAILISVRRGDFVHHPRFYQLSYKYYLSALINHFPDWRNRDLVFTSDDPKYCKRHFSFLPNTYFLDDFSAIEQLAFGSLCRDFIISNSTFSWWTAWLGEKQNSKIITPMRHFRGRFGEITNDDDYFPERWTMYNHHQHSLPIKYWQAIVRGNLDQMLSWINYINSKIFQKANKKYRCIKTRFFNKF